MKNTLLKVIMLSFCILVFNPLFSQSENWEEYYVNDKVKIEYRYMICDFSSTASQEVIIFKFKNLSNDNITLTYDTKIWHNNIEIDTEQKPEEFRKIIRLKNNEIITINCESELREHAIFSAFVDNTTNERYVSLTQFELTNIIITKDE